MSSEVFRLAFRNLYEQISRLAEEDPDYSDEMVADLKDMMLASILDTEPIKEALKERYEPYEPD